MTKQNNSFNFAGVNQFTVSNSPAQGNYTTIQSAIFAAESAGSGTVVILPGTYTENLTMNSSVSLVGAAALGEPSVIISGNATIGSTGVATGNISIQNVTMTAASGSTLTITSNGQTTSLVSISGSTISNTSSSGYGITLTSVLLAGSNPMTISLTNVSVQSSNVAIFQNAIGVAINLDIGYSLLAGTNSCLQLSGGGSAGVNGITCTCLFNNLQSTSGYLFHLFNPGSNLILNVSNCIGTCGNSVIYDNTLSGTTSICGFSNDAFICNATNGYWAVSTSIIPGVLEYGPVTIFGTAQNITGFTQIPYYVQPNRYLTPGSLPVILLTNQTYFVNSSNYTATLPTVSAVGDVIQVTVWGMGNWRINQGAGQQIILSSKNTTLGTAGYVASTAQGDSITLACVVANTTWVMTSCVGNLTVI